MTATDLLRALAGGVLIGASAVLLMFFSGRILGVCGIAGGLWSRVRAEASWRWLFIAGLLAGAALVRVVAPSAFGAAPAISPILLAFAGVLVGFGTRLANGCTSGHGICGNARLSPRSLTATGTFMAAGMLTVFVVRHVVGA